MPKRSTSMGNLPTHCVASQWNKAPPGHMVLRVAQIRARSAMGLSVWITLLAAWIETSRVSGVHAASSAAG